MTQSRTASDANQRTIRTVFQTLLGLAAGFPLIVDAAGIPQTAAGVAVALVVAAAVTRVMALPVVHNLLPDWLYRSGPPPKTEQGSGQLTIVDD
ncbi:hypothetical protein [Streptomyces sp. G-G2]|uniref:hypothetical protein n=1 Tax=Streptomyces sp. G-G2 TaxID=3046201 RepID=UPI0024B95F53|nr:hypothetical protein [Streptomyces sp. G-G2]MDJ0383169.1 hypothetical protein [Streptomyces sp. G-G2]